MGILTMDVDEELSEVDSNDSDLELQVAFERGLLKPGLNVEITEEKKKINDVQGLKHALAELKSELPWEERLDLTVKPLPPPQPLLAQLGDDPDDLSGEGVHDDFKREMKFHRQAQAAAYHGLPQLHKHGISTKRPTDYFAEMAKSDTHMKKIRERLLAKQLGMERSEKAKKLRELRKYGKKVQHEVMLSRQKEKRDMADALKKFRKGKPQDTLDFLENKTEGNSSSKAGNQQKQSFQPNKKRKAKDSKYGFGGQKKRSKLNTKESSRDMSDYSIKKHSQSGGLKKGRPGNKNKKRRGKTQRANAKGRANSKGKKK